jgi:hypothetical protein
MGNPLTTAGEFVKQDSLAGRLERGEIAYYSQCPFKVPAGSDLQFLLQQRLASRAHKNIGFDPNTGKTTGFHRSSDGQAKRLQEIFESFSITATAWLAGVLGEYAPDWKLDRVSYRPEEEATRKLRLKARNDLLHVDAFPTRPTNGQRILRLFVNINPSEPRVWATSDPFPILLERFGAVVGLPSRQRLGLSRKIRSLLHISGKQRSAYDSFMLRMHDFMKGNDHFQEHAAKRFWDFAPGSAWLAFTDVVSHSVLRGRFALEHSYFISPTSLALPDQSPAALLEKACGLPVLRKAG